MAAVTMKATCVGVASLSTRAAAPRQRTVAAPRLSASRPCSLSFSASFSGSLPQIATRPQRQAPSEAWRSGAPLVLAMADKDKDKKAPKKIDSAIKRAKQAEVKRVYNKSRKTEMSTRMKKVFKALEDLKRSAAPSEADLQPIEALISEAYTIIDKSVKVGTIHKNKGARRKSRLARAKRDLSIALGWYKPAGAEAEAQAA